MIVSGVKVNYTSSENEAWGMLDRLDVCANCTHFRPVDLFCGQCMPHFENRCAFPVGFDDKCECFDAKEKKVDYWINKLSEMALEANGQNDFMRQLNYHQRMGTDNEFLDINAKTKRRTNYESV